jgi:hypothetical protein
MKMLKLTPYADRTDLQKIRSQWRKLTGLHGRDEPSAAIVRAATAVELSVNLAIRAEFAAQSELSADSVNGMMRKANGLRNKMQNLLTPLVMGRANQAEIKRLCKIAEKINDDRNEIVHSGYFSSRSKAKTAIEQCRQFIHGIVGLYEKDFDLAPLDQEVIEMPEEEGKAKSKQKARLKKLKKPKG